ncbi:hypothetical protein TNCV_2431621 [Trichonephila clavipes]|nr:hypothetical protein TNCV_2431621 [Trichonephila clavipes]
MLPVCFLDTHHLLGIQRHVDSGFGINVPYLFVCSDHAKIYRDVCSLSMDVENLDELFSDMESDQDSDIYFNTESESSSESENEPVLEFIPGTMDQLIQDLTESVPRR